MCFDIVSSRDGIERAKYCECHSGKLLVCQRQGFQGLMTFDSLTRGGFTAKAMRNLTRSGYSPTKLCTGAALCSDWK